MIASVFIGGFEMLVVGTLATFFTGLGILQRTERHRRALRLLGVALLALGGGAIAFFIIAYIYHEVIIRP